MSTINSNARNIEDEVGIFIGEYVVYMYEHCPQTNIQLTPQGILDIVLKEFEYKDIKHLDVETLVNLAEKYAPAFVRREGKVKIKT